MSYSRKIVLHCPSGNTSALVALVEEFIQDGVAFVGVVGKDCALVEDIIDEIVVGDGSQDDRFILTSSHPDESIEEAIEFANSLTGEEFQGETQLVELAPDRA
jgi:hypothetical protein